MRLVAVATHSERYFPLLQASCRRFGADLKVLCWGEKWRGYSHKLTAMLDYLGTLAEGEVVCMVDAFDTVLLQPPHVLEERFRRSGSNMIIAADGKPPNALVRVFVQHIFPPVDGVAINSGTYIGYAGHLRRLLKQVLSAGYTTQNDQEMIARFCASHPGWLTIDTRSEFFLTFYAGSRWSFSNELSSSLEHAGLDLVPLPHHPPTKLKEATSHAKTGLRWRETGSMPAVLHAPCDGNINEILQRLGYELPESVTAYGSADHLAYLWRATKSYMPLIWDGVLLLVLCIVLFIVALYWVAKTLLRLRSAPLGKTIPATSSSSPLPPQQAHSPKPSLVRFRTIPTGLRHRPMPFAAPGYFQPFRGRSPM